MDTERHAQVVEIALRGEEIRRQHIRAIRLYNVGHFEAAARQAEQSLLRAQERLRQAYKIVRATSWTSWATIAIVHVRNNEEFVRRYEELARQAREVARRAVEALGIAGVAG